MNNLLVQILRKSLDKKVFQYIVEEYDDIRELSLLELGIDSLDYMKLLVSLEETLNLEIEDFDNINSFNDIERILKTNE